MCKSGIAIKPFSIDENFNRCSSFSELVNLFQTKPVFTINITKTILVV